MVPPPRFLPGCLLASFLFVFVTASASASDPHPAEFLRFPDAEKSQLRAGKTVTWCQPLADTRRTSVHCAILLPMRPTDVWDLIDDKEAACDYVSDLQSCKVLRKDGNRELIQQTTRPAGSPKSFTYLLQHDSSPPERMDFRRESGDLRHIEGSWVFDPVDGGTQTLLIYALHIDAGPLMPQKLLSHTQQKRLPEVLLAIRKRLDAHQKQGLCCAAPDLAAPAALSAP